MIIIGTYNLVVNPQWRNVQQQDVYLECDTSDAEVIINLFPIVNLNRFWNVRLIISDLSSNASNFNITINTGGTGDPLVYDTIDEAGNNQIILNQDGESAIMSVVSETSWIAQESKGTVIPTPNLEKVLESGNESSISIQLLNNASYKIGSSSKVAIGSKDNYEIGGGISQVCSLDKEIQWENGVQYYFEQAQPIIHANSINNNIPDNTYDDTKSFQVGSTYTVLNTGLTYICTDTTTDNAVWVLKSLSLQEVLDYNHDLVDGNNFQGSEAGLDNTGVNVIGFGVTAGKENSGDNVIIFGNNSRGNNLSNVFLIGNSFIPSFLDYATASTALSIVNGAVAGNTYLYFDETLNVVGAVRL
jgi:hypothetical protein